MRSLLENLQWKLLSLFIAMCLWYYYVGEQEVSASATASLQFKNLPSGLEISSDLTDRLYVRLRGPVSRLNTLNLSQIAVVIDLSNVNGEGDRTVPVTSSDLVLPEGVLATRIIPSQLHLRFEKRQTKEVPIEVRTIGEPPFGFRLAGASAQPATVTIAGPSSRVQQVSSARTDPVDISRLTGPVTIRVSVSLYDPEVRVESQPLVAVHVILERVSSERN